MGTDPPETFRCRIYGADRDDKRVAFIRRLATDGVLDTPAYDAWIAALDARGWVTSEMETADGGGRYKRWRLTATGRDWAHRAGVEL
jgi:DNA-binding MarR family transcriptional regulator